MKHLLIYSLLSATILAGCSTTDPYSGERKTSEATRKATIGAAAGAVLGVIVGDNKRSALRGAVAGAAIGGSIGYYQDQQEAELRARLSSTGVGVVRDGDNIRLSMPSNITFDIDRFDIRSGFYMTLEDISLVLRKYNQTQINIYGHTDATGGAEYNQLLSERRAQAVGDFLVANGISAQRIASFGYGEQYPIASNDNEEGRAQNRRVELELVPMAPSDR
jgi:outer membrane protein OmpA-like peptidoglycan-associated protein